MWKEIWKAGEDVIELETNDELSLEMLVTNKLLNYRTVIEDVSRKADK